MTDAILNKIVECTNLKFNRVRDAKETEKVEMKALIGLLYIWQALIMDTDLI